MFTIWGGGLLKRLKTACARKLSDFDLVGRKFVSCSMCVKSICISTKIYPDKYFATMAFQSILSVFVRQIMHSLGILLGTLFRNS